MAIDISSIIQNHLTEAETVTETVTESSNGLDVDFGSVVENMDVSGDASVTNEPFLSEGELQAIRGAIVSGVVAAHV